LRGDLSQKDFAKKIGVSHKGYQRYESGERIPRPDILFKIAESESLTVDWLLTGKLRGLEEKILDKERGIPVSTQRVTRVELKQVDLLREKGFLIPSDFETFIDAKMYQALMVVFYESPDIFGFINNVFYLRKQGKFREFLEVIEQFGRIFFEGNKTKLEALTNFLKVLDPGKKEHDPDTQPGQKNEDSSHPDRT
jgi:transcriptional regulator with XRE-family HTH domain